MTLAMVHKLASGDTLGAIVISSQGTVNQHKSPIQNETKTTL